MVNGRLDFFKMTLGWSRDKKFTRGYFPSETLRVCIKEYLALAPWSSKTRLLMDDGREVRVVPRAVASRDKAEVSTDAWVKAAKLGIVQVNVEELLKLKAELQPVFDGWLQDGCAPDAMDKKIVNRVGRAIDMIGKICRLAMTDAAGENRMAHHYREVQSGRLYPTGVSLASAQSVVKDAALTGNWEYDISNCHYAILDQMASAAGYKCLTIPRYLKSKEEVRSDIAKEAGIDYDDVKTCLVSLIYGARVSASPKTAMGKAIGVDAARLLKLSPLLKGLTDDLENAQRVVLANCRRTPRGDILNAFGKSVPKSDKPRQIMAHLLQGAEAKALQAAVNRYPEDIVLVQHDGFVSSRKLDVADIRSAILAATGFDLSVVEKRLKADAYGYFSSRFR